MEGKTLYLQEGTSAEDAISQLKAARNDHGITCVCLGHQDLTLDDGVLSALTELVVDTFNERQWKSIRFCFGYYIAGGDHEGWENYVKTNGRLGGQIGNWRSNLERTLGVEVGPGCGASGSSPGPDGSRSIGGSDYVKFTNTPIVDLGMTQLHVFSRDGKLDEVLSILKEGNVDVDIATQNYGWTPAQLASHNGHVDVLQALMENGAGIDKLNAIGGSPLREAVSGKHLSAVKLLLEHGADANLRVDQNQKTPLQLALMGRDDSSSDVLEIARLLIQHKADPDAWNTTGEQDVHSRIGPPLHMAACGGKVNSLTMLLSNGADVNARDSYDRTALHCARSYQGVEIFRLLVEHGADINAVSGFDGHSALSCAADCYGIEVVRYLVGAGADIEGRVGRDNTPLMCACENRMGSCNIEVVQHLVESGADVNAKNNQGESPLHFACDAHYDNLGVVRYLVEHGADLHAKDDSGKTPYDRSLKEADNANATWYLLEKEGTGNREAH